MSYKSRRSRPDYIQDQHKVVTTRTRSIPGEGPCHHCFVNVNLLRIYIFSRPSGKFVGYARTS